MTAQKPFNYDTIADLYASGVDSAPYNALYERPATLSLLPDVQRNHILDAGCGAGWYAEQLLSRGATVSAIDSSEKMIEHARARLGDAERISFRAHDLAQPLDFIPDHTVDGVLAALVLHYMRDWRPTLREFARVLKPGGWLVMSTHHPATEALRFGTTRYFDVEEVEDDWKWLGKVRLFRRPLSDITISLDDSGFVIERLVEALPVEEFRRLHPDNYERILSHPDFLHIRARVS
jgi:SAM-dependent methyltransferase